MRIDSKIFDRIGLSEELRQVVNRGNMRRLFGLEESTAETAEHAERT